MRGDFAWTLLGNVVYTAAQWGILVVLAKFGSAEIVGQFALGTAITLPILLAANLYLRALVATDARREFAFGDYLGLRIVTTLVAMGLILLIVWVGKYQVTTGWVILIIGAGKVFDALADLCLGLFQQRGRMDYLAATLAVNGVVSIVALGAAMWLTRNVVWAVAGSMLGSAAALAVVALPGAMDALKSTSTRAGSALGLLRPRWDRSTLRTLVWRAAPLGFASLRAVLSLNVPRYFIAYYRGEQELGIFAAIASLVLAGLIVTTSLSVSLTARLARYYSARDAPGFRRLMVRLVEIGLAQGILGVALTLVGGSAILSLVFGAEYAAYQNLLVWLALTGGLYAILSFLETGLTALQNFAVQMQIQLASLALIAGLCLWLVPGYSVYGAAFAMFASALLATLAYILALRRAFRKAFAVEFDSSLP